MACASDSEVRIALANDDLALGETVKAKAELAVHARKFVDPEL